jgi:hypothetical protein
MELTSIFYVHMLLIVFTFICVYIGYYGLGNHKEEYHHPALPALYALVLSTIISLAIAYNAYGLKEIF